MLYKYKIKCLQLFKKHLGFELNQGNHTMLLMQV
jgi:hypothetical protein